MKMPSERAARADPTSSETAGVSPSTDTGLAKGRPSPGPIGERVLLERVPEVLDLLLEPTKILVRVLEEVEQERLHAVRAGEVRVRVAVEELGDPLGRTDDFGGLLLEAVVAARVGVLGRCDVAPVLADPVDLGRRLGEVLE